MVVSQKPTKIFKSNLISCYTKDLYIVMMQYKSCARITQTANDLLQTWVAVLLQWLLFPRLAEKRDTVYPKKYAHGFCFAVLCCGYTLPDFPISIRLTSLALWQSNDCPSASKATLMNMDKYFMRIHYERLHNHNKAKHNNTVCIFLGIYCTLHYVHQ